jgi:peptidoglycan/LPS O-acetylase OafA/YrhL
MLTDYYYGATACTQLRFISQPAGELPMEWLKHRFELSRGGSAHNVRPMEGLRGFAVFLVFLVHYVTLISPWLNEHPGLHSIARAIHAIGNTGVDLFFVLSGYLIYGSLISRQQKIHRFIARRIKRIYPTFITVFLIYIFLSFFFPGQNKIPSPASQGIIYLVQNFILLPGLFPIEPMITVAWSLSYEMFYYLAIPLVIIAFRLRNRSTMFRILFFLAMAAAIAVYSAIHDGHVRLIMFISGIVLYEAIEHPDIPTPHSFFGFLAITAGLLATLLPISGPAGSAIKISILFVSFFLLCLTCFRDSSTLLPRAFSWTPLRWLGNMSYSYYLLHGLTLKAGFLALSFVLPISNTSSWLFWTLLPPMFMLTLIPTTILFLAIERPFSLAPGRSTCNASSFPQPPTPTENTETNATTTGHLEKPNSLPPPH